MTEIRSHGKRRTIIALAAIFTLAGTGAAFAYWTASGTGVGEATTGTSTAFTVTGADAVGELLPGGDGQTVEFTVTNPGASAQTLNLVTVQLADAAGVAWVPADGCLIGDFTAAVTTAPTYGSIAAAGTLTGTVTVTLADTEADQNACKGETVPLYFTAS